MSRPGPLAGGGADVRNITKFVSSRIQAVADRYQIPIWLVGSRASGTATLLSDFDYVISASHRVRNSAKYYLPHGPRVGQGTGIDIFPGPVDIDRPHIIFSAGPSAEGQGE